MDWALNNKPDFNVLKWRVKSVWGSTWGFNRHEDRWGFNLRRLYEQWCHGKVLREMVYKQWWMVWIEKRPYRGKKLEDVTKEILQQWEHFKSFTRIKLWKHRPPDKVWQPSLCEAFEGVTIAVWTRRTMTLQSLKSCCVSGSQRRLYLNDCMKSFLTYGALKQCCVLSDTPVPTVSKSKGKSINYTTYWGFFLVLSPVGPPQELRNKMVDLSDFILEKVKQNMKIISQCVSREWERKDLSFHLHKTVSCPSPERAAIKWLY